MDKFGSFQEEHDTCADKSATESPDTTVSELHHVLKSPEHLSRNLSKDDTHSHSQRMFVIDALQQQQKWIHRTIQKSRLRINEDLKKMDCVVKQHDSFIGKLGNSYRLLDKSFEIAISDLTVKLNARDERTKEVKNCIAENSGTVTKLQSSQYKRYVVDNITKTYTKAISEVCKIRDEIDVIRMNFRKEHAASDERRKIAMDSTRYRLHTSSSFNRNAFKVSTNAVMLAITSTDKRIAEGLKEKRMTFRKLLDSFKQKTTEEFAILDHRITLMEAEAKHLIQEVVKKLDDLDKIVDSNIQTGEDFRKGSRNHMALIKYQPERISEEMFIQKEEILFRTRDVETKIDTVKKALELKCDMLSEEIKRESEILEKQVQYMSRQVDILLQHNIPNQIKCGKGQQSVC